MKDPNVPDAPEGSITSFSGDYAFLSNFWFLNARVWLGGHAYITVEHAYQAAKSTDPDYRARIRATSKPGEAKKLGKRAALRQDWEQVKLTVMKDLIEQKFSRDPVLRQRLLETKEAYLCEGNWWNDTFWGICRGQGDNHLGRLLMETRDALRNR